MLSYLGRYAEAIEDYEEGLGQNPGSYIYLYNIAVATVRWKGLKAGEHAIDRAMEVLEAAGEDEEGAMFYGLGGLAALSGDLPKRWITCDKPFHWRVPQSSGHSTISRG